MEVVYKNMIRTMQKVTIRGRKFMKGAQFHNLQENLELRLFQAHSIFYRHTLMQIYMDIYGWSKDRALKESMIQMNKRFEGRYL